VVARLQLRRLEEYNDDQFIRVGGYYFRIRRGVFLQAGRDAQEPPGGRGMLLDHLRRGHRCRSAGRCESRQRDWRIALIVSATFRLER
jgi:hypothetical protein